MQTTSLRTQIILPKDLRDEIDRQRRDTGESLGEYIRKAAQERLEKEKRKKAGLKNLAALVGSLRGTRSKKEVDAWVRQIRKDREEDDKHWLKRWEEATQMRSQKQKHVSA